MTIDEVAEYLLLHPLTVRRLAREGTLPAYKVGRRWQIGRADLERWIVEQTEQNRTSPAR
jgi:excisionase family DNA binding protein